MRTKVFWLMATLVTLAAVVLASCGPGAAPAPAPTPQPTTPRAAPAPAAPTPVPAAPAPAPAVPVAALANAPPPIAADLTDKPKYGGTINLILPSWTEKWDIISGSGTITWPAKIPFEQFMSADWTTGPFGSNKYFWGGSVEDFGGFGPELATTWTTPEIGTWVFQMRKGVHYALNPNSEASRLVGGREFTPDDAVWSMDRYLRDPKKPADQGIRGVLRSQTAMAKAATIEKTGPWEVTLKAPVNPWEAFFWLAFGSSGFHFMPPKEVYDKYGGVNDEIMEWWQAVGTGPYMISDYTKDSVITFSKNPNWWKTDWTEPGKGNKLPYIDTVKFFIIPDLSTRLATMRTGRADWVTDIESEDARGLLASNPNMRSIKYMGGFAGNMGIQMRTDKEELPFKDKRVRQAMMMATDFNAIKNDLYKGEAEILIWPVASPYYWLYTPLEKLPENVQALYKYNPERAKQLLAEAGYPKGFKTKLIVQNVSIQMDPASVFKAMWAKVGIDVEIQPRETAVYTAMILPQVDELRLSGISGMYYFSIYGFAGMNKRSRDSILDDATVEATYQQMQKNVIINQKEADRLYREVVPYILDQAWVIPRPTPYAYTMWQPWVRKHNGERYGTDPWFLYYAWIDQDMKEKMTGRR